MGIYSTLENAWYAFWEKTPLVGVIDAVDRAIPSLVLFLIIVILLVAGGAYFFIIQNPQTQNVTLSVTVLDSSGKPVDGANVEYTQICGESSQNSAPEKLDTITDSTGKATFSACQSANEVSISVSKTGYITSKDSLLAVEGTQKTITLTAVAPTKIDASISIVDGDSKKISSATLEFSCIKNGASTKKTVLTSTGSTTQQDSDFSLEYSGDCDTMNLLARAAGFNDKTAVIAYTDTQKTITLDKIIQKGTANFTTDSPLGIQAGAEITITDYLNQSQTLITLADGGISQELDAGDYTYSAVAKGTQKSGSFTVLADNVTNVPIYFSDITGNDSNIQNAYLKPVDENQNPLMMGTARIYFQTQDDTNFFKSVNANSSGLIGPVQISDTNSKTYSAILSLDGYRTQIVPIELKRAQDSPQTVTMIKGGYELTVNIIDDLNKPVPNAATQIFSAEFDGILEDSRTTDANGQIVFDGLSDGDYTIVTQTAISAGMSNVTISGGDAQITLQVATGTGIMTYNFYSNGVPVTPSFIAQRKVYGGFDKIPASSMISQKSMRVPATSQLNVLVNDGNYIPFESLLYPTTRETAIRNIYLQTFSGLPNQNPVQMMLRKVLKADPAVSTESNADTLVPGNTYYLLFDLVINTQTEDSLLVNLYADASKGILFEGAKSIDSATVQMAAVRHGTVIDSDPVQADAKQVNVMISDIAGPKMIPVLVKINVDANTPLLTTKTIYWQAVLGSTQSISYSKDFNIGTAFCITDCPDVLFSTYIMNQSNLANPNWVIADNSKINQLQIGDNYKIKLSAQNLSDTDYGTAQLALNVDDAGKNFITFDNNQGAASANTALGPFAKSADLVSSLKPMLGTTGIAVNRSLNSPAGQTDLLSGAIGNNSTVNFSIKNKSSLYLEISNGTSAAINEKVTYPIFVVSTYTKETPSSAKVYGPAYWKATLKRGTASKVLYSGRSTSLDGTDVLAFNATGLNAGDIVAFDAWDEINSAPAHLEVTVTNPFVTPVDAPDCIKVSYVGQNGRVNPNDVTLPMFELNATDNGVIFIDSNCSDSRRININTALHVAPLGTDFSILPGAEQAITVDCYNTQDKCGTLGAFPVTVYSGVTQATKAIAAIDVILKDTNSQMAINSAIWDFSNSSSINGTVTNKVYAGRKNGTLPLLLTNKTGIQLNYFQTTALAGSDSNALGPDINFTVSKLDGLKSGYATLSATDFMGDNNITKNFQVKVINNDADCVSSQGDLGVSGANYDPHLSYDWDFSNISDNECDSSNTAYNYCDAAEFMASTAKRIDEMLNAYSLGDSTTAAKYSTGYSYLIKDNYSQNFLNDFDDYYSQFLSDYVPLSERTGMSKLIDAGRIKFKMQTENGSVNSGALPYGGIYFTSIDINFDDPNNLAAVNTDGTLNATITITFTPYSNTSSANPLYEIPFDGALGKNKTTGAIVRSDYGTTADGAVMLNANNDTTSVTTGGLKNITVQQKSDLTTLDEGIVLEYTKQNILFSPSQPTPIMISIRGSTAPVSAGYRINGYDTTTDLLKIWSKKASTIGGGCYDFEGLGKPVYAETKSGLDRTFSWPNANQIGTMYLTTTFYTPNSNGNNRAEVTPTNPQTTSFSSVSGVNGLYNGTAIQLRYYDVAPSTAKDYATLQGVINLVKKGDMCISKTPVGGKMRVWWNPATINKLETSLSTPDGSSCATPGVIPPLAPLCTDANWTFALNPTVCQSGATQTKTWTKLGNCQGGVTHPATETINCTTVACKDTDWNFTITPKTCPTTKTQTKTWVQTGNCSGGVTHPASESISCTVPCTVTDWKTGVTGPNGYWCVDNGDGKGKYNYTWTKTNSNCSGGYTPCTGTQTSCVDKTSHVSCYKNQAGCPKKTSIFCYQYFTNGP